MIIHLVQINICLNSINNYVKQINDYLQPAREKNCGFLHTVALLIDCVSYSPRTRVL